MLHIPFDDANRQPDWRPHATPGTVLLFAFPSNDDGPAPQRMRPCLVLDRVDHGEDRFVLLADGADGRRGVRDRLDVAVTDPDEIAVAGRRRPIRFVGALRLLVSLRHSGFTAAPASPLLGRLSGAALVRLAVVRRRIAANEDVATEHRVRRRRREIVAGRDFTVEIRRRRRRPGQP